MTQEQAEKYVDELIDELPSWPKLSEGVQKELRDHWIEIIKRRDK